MKASGYRHRGTDHLADPPAAGTRRMKGMSGPLANQTHVTREWVYSGREGQHRGVTSWPVTAPAATQMGTNNRWVNFHSLSIRATSS